MPIIVGDAPINRVFWPWIFYLVGLVFNLSFADKEEKKKKKCLFLEYFSATECLTLFLSVMLLRGRERVQNGLQDLKLSKRLLKYEIIICVVFFL